MFHDTCLTHTCLHTHTHTQIIYIYIYTICTLFTQTKDLTLCARSTQIYLILGAVASFIMKVSKHRQRERERTRERDRETLVVPVAHRDLEINLHHTKQTGPKLQQQLNHVCLSLSHTGAHGHKTGQHSFLIYDIHETSNSTLTQVFLL